MDVLDSTRRTVLVYPACQCRPDDPIVAEIWDIVARDNPIDLEALIVEFTDNMILCFIELNGDVDIPHWVTCSARRAVLATVRSPWFRLQADTWAAA